MVRIHAVLNDRTPAVCREADGQVVTSGTVLPHDTGVPEIPCVCVYAPEDMAPDWGYRANHLNHLERLPGPFRHSVADTTALLLDLHQRTTDMEDVLVKRVAVLEQEFRDLRHKLWPV